MGVPGSDWGPVAVRPYTPHAPVSQTAQALEDMLQALVMDGLDPNMVIVQQVLEVSG